MTKKNDGKYLEKIVELLEKSIDGEAKIEFDQRLPIINSTTGATRQCDVVITTGKPARETVTIVEVQDRKSKTVVNDVGGWDNKRKSVGAHHLICVSRFRFTKTIREMADQSGGTIRLVTLSELNVDEFPFDIFGQGVREPRMEITSPVALELGLIEPNGIKDFDAIDRLNAFLKQDGVLDEVFITYDKKTRASLGKILFNRHQPILETAEGEMELSIESNVDGPLFLKFEGIFFGLILSAKYSWKTTVTYHPFSMISYEQDGHGLMAWLAYMKVELPEGTSEIKIPITKEEDGFRIGDIETIVPEGITLSLKLEPGIPIT